ncbi:7457_t:CDS:1, partial [Racocetra persica]
MLITFGLWLLAFRLPNSKVPNCVENETNSLVSIFEKSIALWKKIGEFAEGTKLEELLGFGLGLTAILRPWINFS